MNCVVAFFFFSSRRRHTRSKRDWSSDVCSSDLAAVAVAERVAYPVVVKAQVQVGGRGKIGRASCRERVEISVVAVSLKKKRVGERVEGFGLGGWGDSWYCLRL